MTPAAAKTTAAPQEPIIAIANVPPKYKGERSGHCYNLEVDGVAWAHIYRESRGMHGYQYWFEQINGEMIVRQRKRSNLGQRGYEEVKIWGVGKRYHARAAEGETTEGRLIDTARKLIAEGLMKHPATQQAEVIERRRIAAESQERREAEESAEFERRAAECLAPVRDHIGDNMHADMVAKIVATMRWAQTQ